MCIRDRLCDDTGIPQTAEKRLEVFGRIMEKAKEYNIDPSRIHIDPLIEMLCTSEDGIAMITEVISTIRAQYPTIHITAAVSNISFNPVSYTHLDVYKRQPMRSRRRPLWCASLPLWVIFMCAMRLPPHTVISRRCAVLNR